MWSGAAEQMPRNPNEPDYVRARVERQRLKRDYSAMFADLAAYLYERDPMGLNYGINPDEYESEVLERFCRERSTPSRPPTWSR
jgi:hypothetical protein